MDVTNTLEVNVSDDVRSGKITRTNIDWSVVENACNSHSSRQYKRYYIREVALGYRSNKQLTKLLSQLGFLVEIQQIQALKQGVRQ